MYKSTNHKHIDLRRPLAAHETELIARAREQIARSLELLRQPAPSTFLGEKCKPDET